MFGRLTRLDRGPGFLFYDLFCSITCRFSIYFVLREAIKRHPELCDIQEILLEKRKRARVLEVHFCLSSRFSVPKDPSKVFWVSFVGGGARVALGVK